jgi:predicted kinase
LKKNTTYLLVGQRGAGKSHYASKLKEQHPELVLISRDEILVRLFGSTSLSPYTDGHIHANDEIFREIEKTFSKNKGEKVLLDHWTGFSCERRSLVRKLRQLGALRVVALYFTTPLPLVEQWFWSKPGIARISEIGTRNGEKDIAFYSDNAPSYDFNLFHKEAQDIDDNGFDEVIRIDPQNELVVLT